MGITRCAVVPAGTPIPAVPGMIGFDVIETSEHRYGCKVSVKSLGIDMRGTPQSDLERRLRVVGLELQVWNELDNSIVVREMRL